MDLKNPPFSPALMPKEILVPFPFESSLSGIRELPQNQHMWYRRNISVPTSVKQGRILLKFEAVDWQTVVYVNGKKAGTHTGGYDGFGFDISDLLTSISADSASFGEIVVGVYDPTEQGTQPHGKQYAAAFAGTTPISK